MSEKTLSLLDHLDELRKRILYSVACIGIFSGIGFFFARKTLNFIIQRSNLQSTYFFSPIEAFTTHIKVALFLGILISFPFILYQSWAFIGPGLTQKEQKVSLSYLFSGVVLFIIGNLFGYFILIPYGLKFLLSFGSESVQPLMNISKYLTFIFWCLLGCGFLFQLPLFLFFLITLGVLDIQTVTKHRPEAIVAILILCAVITPTGDFFTLLLISVPLLLLFELSIVAARLSQRTKHTRHH
jgi:sec-independent protein translocase protein TatC